MRQYVLSLTCACVMVAVAESIGMGRAGKLLSGLFLALVLISPLRDIRLGELWQAPENLYRDGQAIAASAEAETKRSICDIIIERTRTYILDEAEALGGTVTVEAIALDEASLVPIRVELGGRVTPYVRSCLSDFLISKIGLEKEGIVWNG